MSREWPVLHWREPGTKVNLCLGGMPRDKHTNSIDYWGKSQGYGVRQCPSCRPTAEMRAASRERGRPPAPVHVDDFNPNDVLENP